MGKCESTRLGVRRVNGLTATMAHILVSDNTNSALDCLGLLDGAEGTLRKKIIMMLVGDRIKKIYLPIESISSIASTPCQHLQLYPRITYDAGKGRTSSK